MLEVEVKLPLKERMQVQDKIIALGFKLTSTVEEDDLYYNGKFRNLAKTDEALRIRFVRDLGRGQEHSAPACCITYKGPKMDQVSMSRIELETGIEDGKVMDGILKGLGYEPFGNVRKIRESYVYEDCTLCLDRVEGLGDYLEAEIVVETPADAQKTESLRSAALRKITQILHTLGLSMEQTTRRSYLAMLMGLKE